MVIFKKVNHFNQKIAILANKYIRKIDSIKKSIRFIIGILLILIGLVSIINPFINGIFLILLGIRFLDKNIYIRTKNFFLKRKHKKTIEELLDILEQK